MVVGDDDVGAAAVGVGYRGGIGDAGVYGDDQRRPGVDQLIQGGFGKAVTLIGAGGQIG